ncbi:MAG: Holliday junction branch migration protein RuvA [bacterium]
MISRIRGKLVQIEDSHALVENGGVCYEILLPSALAERLRTSGSVGHEIGFETIYYIEAGDRKSAHYPRLVGFKDAVDREFFSLYLQVPGLGVKKALKSLVLPINEIATAIETKDNARLNRLPGVGARLAGKIVAELHGKTTKFALIRQSEPLAQDKPVRAAPFHAEVLAILEQLQYRSHEAQQMIEAALKENTDLSSTEELLNAIFRGQQLAGAGK